MNRIVILGIAICLCIAFCNAQTIREEIPMTLQSEHDGIIVRIDTVKPDSTALVLHLERTFKRRVNERIWQLIGIISYLRDAEKDEQAKSHYIDIAVKFFADDARVVVKKDGIHEKEMKVPKFLNQLSTDKSIAFVSIDSIEIPKWDYALIESDTLGIVYAESEMTAIHTAEQFGETHTMIPIISHKTEDGYEWVPLFGKMIITIRSKNEKNRKNNRSGLNAIGNKLY